MTLCSNIGRHQNNIKAIICNDAIYNNFGLNIKALCHFILHVYVY